MAAYLMVHILEISDPAQYEIYRAHVRPLIGRFGGKPIVIGGAVDVYEGDVEPGTMTVFEFPSMQAIHDFWSSPDYVSVKAMRQGAAKLKIWAVPGV